MYFGAGVFNFSLSHLSDNEQLTLDCLHAMYQAMHFGVLLLLIDLTDRSC